MCVLWVDIGDPAQLVKSLRRIGVDPSTVLHVRSFLTMTAPSWSQVEEKRRQ